MLSNATSTAFSVEYKIAPAQSCIIISTEPTHPKEQHTRRLIFPASQARATAYTYERLAFILVYISATLPEQSFVKLQSSIQIRRRRTLHQLERADRLIKLLPIVDVFHSIIKSGLHKAERSTGENKALQIKTTHQDSRTLVDLAEHVF
jgi:hypothetical protein